MARPGERTRSPKRAPKTALFGAAPSLKAGGPMAGTEKGGLMFGHTLEPWRLLSAVMKDYIGKTVEGWPYKSFFVPAGFFYQEFFHGDSYILVAFYALFFIDLAAGLASALKRQVFSMARFDMWVIKLLVYSACIIVVGFVNGAITRGWGPHFPLLDSVLIFMMVGEAVSIFTNFQELTGLVPPVLLHLAGKVQARAHRRLEDLLEGRGKPPSGGEGENGPGKI
jgi:phage-related holin